MIVNSSLRLLSRESKQRVGAYSELPTLIRELGVDPPSLLAAIGLEARALDDPDGQVSYAAIGALLHELAGQARCAHVGLLVGRMWRLSDLGLVGQIVLNSRTVGEALQTLTVHQHLNSSGGLAFLLTRSATVDLGYAIYHPGVAGTDNIYDAALAAGVNYMRELCGPAWLPSEVLIPHAEPVDVAPYRALFKVHPRFNAEIAALRFPAHWMSHAIDGYDPARRHAAEQRAELAGRSRILDQVARALRLVLLHGKNSGDDVAELLAMHRRTLNRRLKAQGTTFQQVLDTVRFEVARQLLVDSEVTLDDVAASLGYAGVTPFMRTFRRWTGTTPDRWRREAIAEREQRAARRG